MSIGSISIGVALAVAFAASAQAQDSVATLANVQGTVLVSHADGLVAATTGQSLASGARVVATHKSRALVKYAGGCEVVVPENSRTTIGRETSCAVLRASVVTLPAAGAIGGSAGAAGAVSAGSIGVGTTGVAAAAGGIGYGGYKTLVKDRDNSATSGK